MGRQSKYTATAAKEGLNIENMTNKSRKEMAVTVMEMAELPSREAMDALAEVPGIIRVRAFGSR